ncbi:endonuclease/exonuclease/phosphatase family protein [Flavivirga spongiicola]|uniref:Endonuclease/exonuclease/phosphatase family protein n=1 Tax=Flavivirga spongiicola TaxID=421621 RepID=A0ABU7XMQ4_9FLAO|nr:endonuclease/exonuclease/phosphatase family protein [Flavivirga sp. MEBiC05379]MDO5981377.1 endonuclease/exonuclease/phosphatase family protein [Flavivirga sp. MEBiC05379]
MKQIKLKISIALLLIAIIAPVQAQNKKKTIVKVLSYNIYGGRTTKLDYNLEAVAKVIKDTDPDFVAMQEVDYKVNRSKKYDLATELGYRTKMAPIFARAMYYDGGEYGEGVLSKYSFISTRNVPLPYIEGEEPRAALEIITEIPETKDTIAFVGTHFAHEGNAGREIQAKRINEVFSKNKYPTILAGDLNATPGSGPINTLEEMWQTTYDRENPEPTIPSDNPRTKLDYVMFYPKNRWKVLDKKVIADTYASDHCVYLVTLELLDE